MQFFDGCRIRTQDVFYFHFIKPERLEDINMDENTLFRSALHGFKREDVMDYITKTARQNEAALQALQAQLDEAKTQLADTTVGRDLARQALDDATAELEQLRGEARDFDALNAQLNEANEQIAVLQLQLKDFDKRQASELEAVRSAGREALKQYQQDADGYAVLAEKAGRILLRAENTGEAIRVHAQEEADSALQEAKVQADALLASAQEQADALLADAQARVAAAQADVDALHAQAEVLFRESKQRFESTQDSVNASISRAMSEVEQMRSMLLELSSVFNHSEVSFEEPDCEAPDEELASVGE